MTLMPPEWKYLRAALPRLVLLYDLAYFYFRCRFACDSLPLRNFRLLQICTNLPLPAKAALLALAAIYALSIRLYQNEISRERQRIIGAEASRIAAPMAASDAMLPRRLPIPQAVHFFKPQSRNVKTFLLGDLKGAVLFCEREQPPLPRSLLARRDNFALY